MRGKGCYTKYIVRRIVPIELMESVNINLKLRTVFFQVKSNRVFIIHRRLEKTVPSPHQTLPLYFDR